MSVVDGLDNRLKSATSFRSQLLLCIVLFGWFFLDVGPRARLDRTWQHRTDVTVYTEAGAAFFDGRNPYEVTNVRGWHYLYPPMFALLMAPLSLLETWWQAFIWFSISVALCFGCFHECKRLLRILIPDGSRHARLRPRIGLIVWLTAFFPFLNTMQRGQVGIAVLYPLLLGFRLVLQNRSRCDLVAGGLFLSLPVVLKLTPAMPAGFLILQQFFAPPNDTKQIRWRQSCCIAGGLGTGLLMLVFAIPSALLGPEQNLAHLDDWVRRVVTPDDPGAVNNFRTDTPKNQSLVNAVKLPGRYFNRQQMSLPGWIVNGVRVALVGSLLLFGLGVSRQGAAGTAAAFGVSGGLTLMVSPLSWGHHFTLMVPAVLSMAVWLVESSRSTRAVAIAAIPPVLCWLHWLALDTYGKLGVLGLGSAVWFSAALLLFARSLGKQSNRVVAVARNLNDQTTDIRSRAA